MSSQARRAAICGLCAYYHPQVTNDRVTEIVGRQRDPATREWRDVRYPRGECRRNTPRAAGSDESFSGSGHAIWPAVMASDWCGEFALSEEAIVEDRKYG
jgi:hypothetical protein